MERVLFEVIGYCTEGGSDKEYRICLVEIDYEDGVELRAFNGKRGRCTTVARNERHASLDLARKALRALQASKEKKHYHFTSSDEPAVAASISAKTDTGLRPMLQTAITREKAMELCFDDSWCAQRKYDGEHLLARRNANGSVTFANKLGFETSVPAAIAAAFAKGPAMTVSGELLKGHVVLYDVLAVGDIDVRHRPFEQRIAIADAHAASFGDQISVAPTAFTTDEKLALVEKVDAERWEGWIFKNRHAAYEAGRKHDAQFKVKRWKSATCQTIGHSVTKRSISVGVVNDVGLIVHIGDVTVKSNQEVPEMGSFVEVKYLDYHAGGKLTQPELLVVRTDVTLNDCSIDQLEGLADDVAA